MPDQVLIGVVILFKGKYNINNEDHHSSADALNNLTVWMIFAVTVINVFVSAFGIDNSGPIITRTYLERNTYSNSSIDTSQ